MESSARWATPLGGKPAEITASFLLGASARRSVSKRFSGTFLMWSTARSASASKAASSVSGYASTNTWCSPIAMRRSMVTGWPEEMTWYAVTT